MPVVITTGIGLAGTVIVYRQRLLSRRYRSHLRSKYLPDSECLDLEVDPKITDAALLTLLNEKPDDDPTYINELQNIIPLDLYNFKYLLHPTRVMMLKILYGEYRITAADTRKVLDVPSGEFSTQKKSLKERGYIRIETSFSLSASRKQTLYLTKRGKQQFRQVTDLLKDLVSDQTPYHYLLRANELVKEQDDLYPHG